MVILVGTDHTLQTTRLQLKAYLEGLCRKFNIRAIAEEMNAEALSDLNTVSSIPQRVAGVLRIPHRYCDPNRAERAKLDIRQENDIRKQAFLSNAALSESEIAACVAESHAKREQYWLMQLRNLNAWPVLFVCGADHVASFSELLALENISVHVAVEDWANGRNS